MRAWQQWRSSSSRWLGLLVTATAILWGGVASADRFPPDPVEGLRQILKPAGSKPAARAAALDKQIPNLRTLSDLRRALLLQDWRDEDEFDDAIRKVDQVSRNQVLKRFEEGVREVLARGTVSAQLAVVQMLGDQVLGEISASPRGSRIRGNVGIIFGPDMAEMVKKGEPRVRAAAARALGKMNAKAEVAVPALSDLLASGDSAQRRAAAEGLLNLVASSQNTASRLRDDLVDAGRRVAKVAARGLRDADPVVRRLCAEILYQAASVLRKQVAEPSLRDDTGAGLEDSRKETRESLVALQPLVRALQDQAPALARALGDPDPQVRLFAGQALEELGSARVKIAQLLESLPPGSSSRRLDQPAEDVAQVTAEEAPGDPLLQALRETLPALRRALADPDVRVQLSILEVLEALGPDARPAAPELIQALCHPDRYVRWAAARALGKVGPVEVAAAVAQLSQMLFDKDLDLRVVAATALERFGPAAREAVPALIRALGATDAEMRLAAMRALDGIGTDAQPAIPALAAVLTDPDLRVRRATAEILGKFGPLARDAEAALRRTLTDSSAEVRQAASDALLSILK
ncbi:MAG: HEAT repeat domain-containing protein [Gemmataceae bacterium]|nr:HEAT repeat domain-containing protein [Gemmataceae bacterium]